MSNRSKVAEMLAGSPAAFDSQGLEQPPEVTQALMALLMPPLGGAVAKSMAGAPQKLASGAGAGLPESLPEIAAGAKAGDPHALFAYYDNFGPNMTKRAVYNVFGDPAHPTMKTVGWGSSIPEEMLQANKIPIVGRQAPRGLR